jgi:hypothetical protein
VTVRSLRFQTRYPTGQVEQITIDADRVVIGSGAHCDIRLPLDQARAEHVLVEAGPAALFARALNFEPPPTIDGIPFTQAPLPPGALLGISGTQSYVEALDVSGQALAGAEKKGTSKVSLLAMLFIIGGALFFLFDDPEPADELTPVKEAPELWGEPVTVCPYKGPQALAYAGEQMAIADSKRERRPFYVKDGVEAVPLYERAAACFREGGDAPSAKLATDSALFMRRDVADEFRAHRVRLDRALATKDHVTAQKEVRVLLQLVEGKQHEWVTWLQNLDRRLKLKVGSAKGR